MDNTNNLTIQPLPFAQRANSFLRLHWLLLLGLCFSTSIATFSQNAQARFRTIDSRQGLANPEVVDIFQDSYSFVWLATNYGLFRFDGYECAPFQVEPGNPHSISSNSMAHHALCEGPDGNLWVATSNGGLNRFDRQTERFDHFNMMTGHLNMDQLTDVVSDGKNGLWVATLGRGLNHLDLKTGETTIFHDGTIGRDTLMGSPTLVNLHLDSKGRLWIGTLVGASYFNNADQTFTRFWPGKNDPSELSSDFVVDILEDRDGNIWLATQNGLNRWDETMGTFEKFYPAEDIPGHPAAYNYIKELLEDRDGNLWLGTLGGLVLFEKKKRPFRRFQHDPADAFSVRPGPINALMEDRTGNIWVGTNHGASLLNKAASAFSAPSFQQAQLFFKNKEGGVLDMLEADGAHWFSTPKGVFWQRPGSLPELVLAGSGHDLFRDSQGRVYVSIFDQGFSILDPRSGRVLKKFSNSHRGFRAPDRLEGLRINAFAEDAHGHIWAGTKSCLNRLQPESGKIQHFSNMAGRPESLSSVQIEDLLIDRYGNLWVATLGGLNMLPKTELGKPFDNADLRFQRFMHQPDNPNSISSNTVFDLFEDRDGRLWVGTETGLNCYSKGQWQRFFTKDGLPGNKVTGILQDDRGLLWISTANNGLASFDPRMPVPRFEHFSINEGLDSDRFHPHSCAKMADGTLVFCHPSGITAFHPDSLPGPPTEVPPLYLVDFQLFNRSVLVQDNSLLKRPAWLTDAFTLGPKHKVFAFKFAALDFANPEKLQYRYLLQRSSHRVADTIFLGQKREVTFNNLPSGNYRLEIQCATDGFNWQGQDKPVAFIVPVPWPVRWWALLGYFMAFCGLSYWLYRWRLRRKLEANERLRLQELNAVKNRFFTNISHEFRTPLTLINGLTSRWISSKDEALRTDLKEVKRHGQQLLDLVNQILDLAKLESGTLSMNWVQGDVVIYFKYLLESFHSLADAKNISLDFHASTEHFLMDHDAEKLRHIVSNLLSNAIKFTPAGGQVTVSVSATDEQLELEVADTGIGISPEQLPRIFDRFFQADDSLTRPGEGTGIGLALVQELAKLLGGSISAVSPNPMAAGAGSVFTLRLPVSRTAPMAMAMEMPRPANGTEKPLIPHLNGSNGLPSLLIVEDNADVLHYLASVLGKDYHVSTQPNGRAGLDRALETVPDLVISDVMMPEMDGYEFCRRLKNELTTSHIPVVLLTAKADADSKMQGIEIGANAYLPKPFEERELKLLLKNLLANREKMRRYYTSEAFLMSEVPVRTPAKPDDELLKKFLDTVEANLDNDDLSAEKVAELMHMSYSNLYRKLHALTGMGVTEYTRHIRLHRAAQLLAERPELTIIAVAQEVGFTSQSYFGREFKKTMGYSASEWRRLKELR